MKKIVLLSFLSLISLSFQSVAMNHNLSEEKTMTPIRWSEQSDPPPFKDYMTQPTGWRKMSDALMEGEYTTEKSKVFATKRRTSVNLTNEMGLTEENDDSLEWVPYTSEEGMAEDPLGLSRLTLGESKKSHTTG